MFRLLPIFALVALACPVRAVGDSGHIVYAKAKIVADLPDTDGDGLVDVTERQLGTDSANPDTDGDGLTDGDEEILAGSSALAADTDGDGFGDGLEVAAGSDPSDAASFPVTVAGVVSNTVAGLTGPLIARLIPSDVGAAALVTNNPSATQVVRDFRGTGVAAAFSFTNGVACNVPFCIEAWADVNDNGLVDLGEPKGACEAADGVTNSVPDVVVLLGAGTADPDAAGGTFDYVGTYDGEAHTILTNELVAAYAAAMGGEIVVEYAERGDGGAATQWMRTAPAFTDACETSFWYRVRGANYADVIHPGKVVITARHVTLTSGTKTFGYDGTAHADRTVTVGGDGFVAGEGVTTDGFATITDVGSAPNAFAYAFRSDTLAANYAVSCVTGLLTVVKGALDPAKDPEPFDPSVDPDDPAQRANPNVRFSAFDFVGKYDGEGHTIRTNELVAAYRAATGGDVVVEYGVPVVSAVNVSAVIAWASEAPVFTNACVASFWYRVRSANYADVVRPCKVVVTARRVTLTSGTKTFEYDGAAHADRTVTVGGDGFIADDGVTVDGFATIMDVGSKPNAFSYAFRGGTLAANYGVACVTGTLTVVRADIPPPLICVDPEPHVDVAQGEVASCAVAATVYDGYLYDGEVVVGTIRVNVSKGKVNKKSGRFEAKVTATVTFAGSTKKVSFKRGIADETGAVTGLVANGHALDVMLGVDGLGGTCDGYKIDGARNVFSGKSDADKAAAADAARLYQGIYNLAFGDGTLTVTVNKKGKAKIVGSVGGNKVSAAGQLVVGVDCATVPVVIVKKTLNLAFCLWLKADGTAEIRGDVSLSWKAGRAGNIGEMAKFSLDLMAGKLDALTGLYRDFLPHGIGVSPDGKKWIVAGGAKAGKPVLQDKATGALDMEKSKFTDNMSGLKLSYKPKDGTFTGSFKVYGFESGKIKSYTAKVTGVVIEKKGYGTATIKKPYCLIPVEIE